MIQDYSKTPIGPEVLKGLDSSESLLDTMKNILSSSSEINFDGWQNITNLITALYKLSGKTDQAVWNEAKKLEIFRLIGEKAGGLAGALTEGIENAFDAHKVAMRQFKEGKGQGQESQKKLIASPGHAPSAPPSPDRLLEKEAGSNEPTPQENLQMLVQLSESNQAAALALISGHVPQQSVVSQSPAQPTVPPSLISQAFPPPPPSMPSSASPAQLIGQPAASGQAAPPKADSLPKGAELYQLMSDKLSQPKQESLNHLIRTDSEEYLKTQEEGAYIFRKGSSGFAYSCKIIKNTKEGPTEVVAHINSENINNFKEKIVALKNPKDVTEDFEKWRKGRKIVIGKIMYPLDRQGAKEKLKNGEWLVSYNLSVNSDVISYKTPDGTFKEEPIVGKTLDKNYLDTLGLSYDQLLLPSRITEIFEQTSAPTAKK